MENMLYLIEDEEAGLGFDIINKIKINFGAMRFIRSSDLIREICAYLDENEALLRKRHIISTNITLEYCEIP